ncbi:hypothetical protein V6N13_027918 [Hibiscus sabdariffa]
MDLVDPNSSVAQEFRRTVWGIMEEAGKPNLADYFPLLRKIDPQGSVEELNRNHSVHLFLVLFAAETDTTSSTSEWTMAEVLRNPQVLHKAKKELEQAIGKGNPIEECDINCLPYLQAIMKETFRLFCCYSLVELAPDADLVGFRVPEGSLINSFDWELDGGISSNEMNMEEKFGITLEMAEPLRAIHILV